MLAAEPGRTAAVARGGLRPDAAGLPRVPGRGRRGPIGSSRRRGAPPGVREPRPAGHHADHAGDGAGPAGCGDAWTSHGDERRPAGTGLRRSTRRLGRHSGAGAERPARRPAGRGPRRARPVQATSPAGTGSSLIDPWPPSSRFEWTDRIFPAGLTLTLRQPSMLTVVSILPTTNQARDPAIRVRGLEKSYKELRVLRGVDFEVARGSIFALLGSNGAGKTTV